MMSQKDVSHNDIYEAIGELKSEVRSSERRHQSTEERLIVLEQFQNKAIGAILAAGAVCGLVTTAINLVLK